MSNHPLHSRSLHTRRRLLLAGALLGASVSLGCTASSKYMHPNATAVAAPPQDAATVVFVRPSSFASAVVVTIIDERGKFVGESNPQSHFAVTVPAGPHVFIAWAENTAALRANLAPGKTYFVEVAPKMGALSARAHLLAVKPKSENWAQLPGWLSKTTGYTADLAAGQAYLERRKDDTDERVKRGLDALTKYSPDELAERTLRPEDGK